MKKKIRFVLLSAAFAGAVFISCSDDNSTPAEESVCIPTTFQDGLIAAYTFGNGSLNDGVGNANLTAFNSQPGEDRDGNPECAYVFTGQYDSYLTAQNTGFLNGLTEMSVSFWYKPGVQPDHDFEVLISRGDGLHCPDTNGQWSVSLYDCRRAVFGHGNSVWDNFTGVDCNAEAVAGIGVWVYVTATYNQANNELKIYRNGQLQESDSGFADCNGNGAVFVPTDTGDLIIGKGFSGTIDDIAIYNKVLTQAEILALNSLNACCQ